MTLLPALLPNANMTVWIQGEKLLRCNGFSLEPTPGLEPGTYCLRIPSRTSAFCIFPINRDLLPLMFLRFLIYWRYNGGTK